MNERTNEQMKICVCMHAVYHKCHTDSVITLFVPLWSLLNKQGILGQLLSKTLRKHCVKPVLRENIL